jgi:hypothetical protein
MERQDILDIIQAQVMLVHSGLRLIRMIIHSSGLPAEWIIIGVDPAPELSFGAAAYRASRKFWRISLQNSPSPYVDGGPQMVLLPGILSMPDSCALFR